MTNAPRRSARVDLDRESVRATDVVLMIVTAVVMMGAGCTEESAFGPDQGAVRVSVAGLDTAAEDAGSVRIMGNGLDITVGLDEPVVERRVPYGVWDVFYTPPTEFAIAPGATNFREVTIDTDGPTPVQFAVVRAQGTLIVNVSGLNGSAASGGSVQVLRTDIAGEVAVTLNIPAAGTGTLAVVAGTYRATYTPPTGYQLANGQSNPRNTTIDSGEIDAIAFAVEAVSTEGSLTVNVSGLTGGSANGGSAQVLRTDTVNQTPVILNIPLSGAATLAVVAGTYRITYSPPTGFQLVSGQTNPRNVTVDAGEAEATSFVVETVPATNGTLTVNVSGLTSAAANGGSAQVLRTDIAGQNATTLNIPLSGAGTLNVVAGTYRITYSPPTGFQLASGQTNPRNVTVDAGEAEATSFVVETVPAAEGTLTVNVSGLTSAAANGGSAQVLRTDIAGQNETTLNIPLSGAGTLNVVAGTYRITYSPPTGFQLASGQANPRNVTVDAGEAEATSFVVEETPPPPPVPGGLVFASDWRTGRGTSESVLTDGGRWDALSSTQNKEIVASTGLDFPTDNVFRVTHVSSSSPRIYKHSLPIPAVGESRFYRWYMRVTMPDNLSDNSTHPIEAGGAAPWAFEIENAPSRGVSSGHFGIWFYAPGEGSGSNFRWYLGSNNSNLIDLDKNTTYRIEYQFHRTGTSTYRQHVRIYDSGDRLLYDDSDFSNYDGSVSMASNPNLSISGLSGLSTFQVGNNGISGSGPFPFTYGYQAAFCIRSDTWCGRYNGTY